jgi:hypothetical protein
MPLDRDGHGWYSYVDARMHMWVQSDTATRTAIHPPIHTDTDHIFKLQLRYSCFFFVPCLQRRVQVPHLAQNFVGSGDCPILLGGMIAIWVVVRVETQ